MISDFVKGKKQYDYPAEIQLGIKLHRAIDAFTDAHPSTQKIKTIFAPTYRLYAGAFADVVYDHFLANDRKEFKNDAALMDFTKQTFALLHTQEKWLGERFGAMFPFMESQNWLYHYQYDNGIRSSFEGLRRRAAYIEESATAYSLFLQHKPFLQECYEEFFSTVKNMAARFLKGNNIID